MGELALSVIPIAEQYYALDAGRQTEQYAQSLRLIRAAGQLAVGVSAEVTGDQVEAMLRADVETCLAEMLNTDTDFRDRTDINHVAEMAVSGGKVVDRDGRPMAAMVRAGVETSRQAMDTEPRMDMQVIRDEGDILNAEAVDELLPGQLRLAVSLDPKEAIARDGKEFWEDEFCYREGLAFIQWYYRQDDDTLVTGTLSVDNSDLEAWKQMWAERGYAMPDDVDCNHFIRHGLTYDDMTTESAAALAEGLRHDYYQRVGTAGQRLSVTEFIRVNADLVDEAMNQLYLPMTTSLALGQKDEAVGAYVADVLQNSQHLAPEIRQRLLSIHNRSSFDDDAARTVDFVIRYGLVEALRERLKEVIAGGAVHNPEVLYNQEFVAYHPGMSLVSHLAAFVAAGVTAGRSYGGCLAAIKMSALKNENGGSDFDDLSDAVGNLQEAYGGATKKKRGEAAEWHGGKLKRSGSCNVCKKDRIEVGGCDICQVCVKNPIKMGLAYKEFELEKVRKRPTILSLLMTKNASELAA